MSTSCCRTLTSDESDFNTADGRAATVEMSRARLARMLCCDRDEFSLEDARAAAQFIANVQLQILSTAAQRIRERQSEPFETVVVSGSGSFLAARLCDGSETLRGCNVISLPTETSPAIAEAACAYAVARLAEDTDGPA